MIQEFISRFTEKKIEYVKVGSKYYLKNDFLFNLSKDLTNVESVSLFLGEDIEDKFKPSLALLEILAKVSEEKVFVTDIGQIDFIYGRKKLSERHISSMRGKGSRKLVQNEHDENLGYCKVIDKDKIKNLLDRGDYLRREKNQKRA